MIIGLTGYAGAGKDAAAQFLIEDHGFTRIAFADPMREILYALNPIVGYRATSGKIVDVKELVDKFGWDQAKRDYPEIRALLQRLGTEGGREILGENIWVDTAMRKASHFSRVVFTDCRFENEAKAIREAGGTVLRVTRPGVGPVNGHVSDKGLPNSLIDGEILNNGTLEDLRRKVAALF